MTDPVVSSYPGWRKVTCEEREAVVLACGYYYPDKRDGGLVVLASRTDHYGQYGLPMVYTEWGTCDGDPVLRDVRHPAVDLEQNPQAKDRLPCEHYLAREESDD